MASMARDSWTNERLDDLKTTVDEGFRDNRAEFRAIRADLALSGPDHNTGDVKRVVDAAYCGIAEIVVRVLGVFVRKDDAAVRRWNDHRPLLRLSRVHYARCDQQRC